MIRPLHSIELKGRKVELLFTPSLYAVGAKRGIVLTIDDTENYSQVLDAYCKVMYLAALNAWEVRAFDNPDQEEFDLTLMDFVVWSTQETKTFGSLIKIAIECLTGKPFDETATDGEVKKK